MIKARQSISFGQWTIAMPGTARARRGLGICLVVGGVLGFLPVLGFWMIPLGLFVLSIDSPVLRRFRRKWQILLEHKKRSDQLIMASQTGASQTGASQTGASQTGDWSGLPEADRVKS